jgi:trigger factor
MVGMKTGEAKDLNVSFPEGYQAENLAGKAVVFKVKLHEIKSKKVAELNDEFVVSLESENVKTVEELKTSVKERIKERKSN